MLNSTVTQNAVTAAFHSAATFTWHTTHNARAFFAAYSANKYGKSGTWGTIG